MKTLKIFAALCLIIQAFAVLAAGTKNGEVLAVLKAPAGIELTEQSLKDGNLRKFIEVTAESAGGKLAGMFDALSLVNEEGNIFVFIKSDRLTSHELASALKQDPNVVSASPNREVNLY